MVIFVVNNDKFMLFVYYLLKFKFMEFECIFVEIYELLKELDEDDFRMLFSYVIDVEVIFFV